MTGDLDRGAEGTVILCAANSYEEKYYLNQQSLEILYRVYSLNH